VCNPSRAIPLPKVCDRALQELFPSGNYQRKGLRRFHSDAGKKRGNSGHADRFDNARGTGASLEANSGVVQAGHDKASELCYCVGSNGSAGCWKPCSKGACTRPLQVLLGRFTGKPHELEQANTGNSRVTPVRPDRTAIHRRQRRWPFLKVTGGNCCPWN